MLDERLGGDDLRVPVTLDETAAIYGTHGNPPTPVMFVRYVNRTRPSTAHVVRNLTTHRRQQCTPLRPAGRKSRLGDIRDSHTESSRHGGVVAAPQLPPLMSTRTTGKQGRATTTQPARGIDAERHKRTPS